MLSVPSSKGLARGGMLPWLAGNSFPCLLEPGPHSRLSSFPGDLQPRGFVRSFLSSAQSPSFWHAAFAPLQADRPCLREIVPFCHFWRPGLSDNILGTLIPH